MIDDQFLISYLEPSTELVCLQPSNLIECCDKPWCLRRINLINWNSQEQSMNSLVNIVTPFTLERLAENWKKWLSEHESRAAGSKSAVNEHVTRSNNTHQIDWDIVKVLEKEPKNFPRKVLEAIHIRKKGPNLNRDTRLDLNPVWDNLINPTKTRGTRTDHQSSLTSQ